MYLIKGKNTDSHYGNYEDKPQVNHVKLIKIAKGLISSVN